MKGIFNKIIIFTFIFILLFSCFGVVSANDDPSVFSDDELNWIDNIQKSNSNYKKFFAHHNNGQTVVYFINSVLSSDKFYLKGTSLYCTNTNLVWYKYIYPSTVVDWSGASTAGHSHFNTSYDRYCSDIIYTDSSLVNISYTPPTFFKKPYVANTAEDLATGKFDSLLIIPNDAINNLGVKIHKLNKSKFDINNDGVDEDIETFETLFSLNFNNNYLNSVDSEYWYEIPFADLGINFNNGTTYVIQLVNDINKIIYDDTYECYQETRFTIGRSYC